MPVASSNEFWKLVLEAKLLPKEVCKELNDQFKQKSGGKGDAKSLAQFLVKGKHLTPYQAKALLAEKPGTLVFGGYVVLDLVQEATPQPCLLAQHRETEHTVWLHTVPKAVSKSEAHRQIVQRMCQMRCSAPHPHLIRCFELLEHRGRHFLVTEQLTGNRLQESRPEPGNPIPPPDCSRLTRQLTLAVAHLHQQGMVVRDITRDRLWLEENGNLKLLHLPVSPLEPMDWKSAEPTPQAEALADVAAPELAAEGAAPTPLSDLYAIGCHYFDLLTGNMPFDGDIPTKLEKHAKAPVPQPPFVPAAVMQILIYLLAKNPNVRYQGAMDVAESIRPFVDPAQLAPPPANDPPTLSAYLHAIGGPAPAAQEEAPAAAPFPTGASPEAAPAPFPGAGPPQPPLPGDPAMVAPPAPPPFAGPPPVAPPVAGSPVAASPVAAPPVAGVPFAGQPMAGQTAVAPPAAGVPVAAVAVAQPAQDGVNSSRASAMAERIRKRKLRKKITNLVILGVLSIGVLVGGLMVPRLFTTPDDTAQHDPPPVDTDEVDTPDEPAPTPPPADGPRLVDDDGKTLWASPTQGEPIDLTGLPPDTKLVLHARPSQWTRTPQGERTLRALGPGFDRVRAEIETSLATPFDSIDELLVGIGPTTPASFPCIIVRVGGSTDFPSRWGNPDAEGTESLPLYTVNGWKAAPLPGSPNQGFVAGSPAAMDAMATSGLGTPNLTREMEQLRRSSDSSRHVSVLVDPQFLQGSANVALPGGLQGANAPIRQLLGDGLRGGLFSANLDDTLYIEMRLAGSLNQNAETLAQTIRERLQTGARRLEDEIPNLNATSYWRRLANRFPAMVRFAYQNARSGSENNLAIVNVVLPPSAAQNLVAASELMLAAQGGPVGQPTQMAESDQKKPETIAEKLQSKISIQFPQNSLEFAIRDLGDEIDMPMQIVGGDLQMEGITRNQEIKEFAEEDKTFEEILVALLMRANPVTTVTSPTEVDQKLIYVIDPMDGPEEEKKVLITTRTAAQSKGYTIPDVFKP